MQILVTVATIQVGTLKAEVEKGIITTVVGYELTDPKAKINLVNEIICSARCFSSSYEQESANTLHTKIYLQCRKGIRLIFLSLDPVLRGNANELGDVSRCPGKSSLFFLTVPMTVESYCMEIRLEDW